MFAIIETGGKQYKVSEGEKFKIEKIKPNSEGKVIFDKVLLINKKEAVNIGTPYIKGAKVEGDVLDQKKEKTKIVFRYHSKTRYRKLKGHRQPYTLVKISKIDL